MWLSEVEGSTAGRLESWGPVRRVGVEGTGSYGAGLARHLAAAVSAAVPLQRSRQLTIPITIDTMCPLQQDAATCVRAQSVARA